MTLEDALNKYIKNKSCELDNFRFSELIDDLNYINKNGMDLDFFNSVNLEEFNLTKLEKSFLIASMHYLANHKYFVHRPSYDIAAYRLDKPYLTFDKFAIDIRFRAYLLTHTPAEFKLFNIYTGDNPLSVI